MPNYNKVILCGHLTRDPEMIFAKSGTPLCKLGIGTNHKRKDKPDEVLFVDLVAFGKTAEAINQYCHRGDPLLVEGRLQLEQWKDKEGKNRSKISIVVEQFQFLGGKKSAPKDELNDRASETTPEPPKAPDKEDPEITF